MFMKQGLPIRRVAVTGLGAVSPLGLGASATWRSLLRGDCGIDRITEQHGDFSSNGCRVAGLVPRGSKVDARWETREWISRDQERKLPRFMQYGLVAAAEALNDAQWLPNTDYELERTGVCLGSGIGAFEDICETALLYKQGGAKKVSPYFVPRILINLGAAQISMKYGFTGPTHAAATACTTGAHSIADAARFIQSGEADVMLAGGAESCIHPLAFTGFERSKSLTTTANENPRTASQPFNADRNGFVIAEGAALLVLEDMQHAVARGAHVYAELLGTGSSSDAHHLTQPPENGAGALRAMRSALRAAGLDPGEVSYINAHATSTPLGDIAESRAISQLMTAARPGPACPVSSTKGATGHLLGAAGALEALFTVLAVKYNVVPPTLNLNRPDPEMPQDLDYVSLEARHMAVDVALSNSFGFGGTNATLCFSKPRY